MVLHYGSGDVYVGDRWLDGDLDDHFNVEIPLYSPGVAYKVCVIFQS